MAEELCYLERARADAWDTFVHFFDDMLPVLRDPEGDDISDNLLNDYEGGDEFHHANHVDIDWSLTEAAEILDQLSEYEESDRGLWEGLEPKKAVAAQAAYTYGNAVMDMWRTLIEAANDHCLEDFRHGILHDMTGEDDPATRPEVLVRVKELIHGKWHASF